MIGWQYDQFSCVASIGSTFAFEVEDKQDNHGNSRNGSKGGKVMPQSGPPLPSDSNETELKPPAKSPSTRSKDQDKLHTSLGKVTSMIKKSPKLHIIRHSHTDNVMNLLLSILVPMQESKTVM